MSRKLNVALVLFIAAPVLLMSWLGLRSVRLEREQSEARLRNTATRLLVQYDADFQTVITTIEQALMPLLDRYSIEPEALRGLVRDNRFMRQAFIMDVEGRLLYPNPDSNVLTAGETRFLERTAAWRRSGDVFVNVSQVEGDRGVSSNSGWYTWFWEDGIHFLLWKRMKNGDIHGVEVDRFALLSEVIAAMPHTRPTTKASAYEWDRHAEYIALRGPRGEVLYSWGQYTPEPAAPAWAVHALASPLAAWELVYYGAPLSAVGLSPAMLGILLVILAVFIVMTLAVIMMVREHSRTVREAQQRVSFVNQVSHELKTPLTNIRMYSELLEQRVSGKDEKAAHYTSIMLSESRRLARMIHNVLSFGKQGRGALRLHRSRGIIDESVEAVLEHFGPVFESKGIRIHFSPGCSDPFSFDRDVLEQVLGNLLANAKKYAGEGAQVWVTTVTDGDHVKIEVRDDGPGVPARYREQIFKPFFRLDDRLTQKVSGAGIGLSISRELARLHGGDLVLVESKEGARFCFSLKVDPEENA
jgi:signal transduction histidine kinase